MVSPPPSPHDRLARALSLLAAVGLAVLGAQIVLRCLQPLGNTDVFWQVRAGELALDTGRVPAADPFSYTIHGVPWNNHEWAFELAAAWLHRAFGWGALRLLVLVCWGGAAFALAARVGRRAGLGAAFLALSLFHAFAGYKLKPVPQTVSMPLMLGAMHLFLGPAMLTSRRRALALVAYLLAWGNVTAEALTFLPMLAVDQLCLRLGRRPGEPAPDRLVALLLVVAALAPLVNPPWSSTLDYALHGTAINRLVNTEFTPLWLPAAAVQPFAKLAARLVVALYLAWSAAVISRADDRWKALRRGAPGLIAVASAVLLERNLWLLVVPAASMLTWLARRRPRATNAAALALAALVSVVYARRTGWDRRAHWTDWTTAAFRTEHLNAAVIPRACVDPLAHAPPGARLFTQRLWASYAIWRLPSAQVFYDGRNLEYGMAIQRAGLLLWRGDPGAGPILDRTRTDVVIAEPGWNLRPGLRGGPWRPARAEANCTVFVRAAP